MATNNKTGNPAYWAKPAPPKRSNRVAIIIVVVAVLLIKRAFRSETIEY